MSYIKLLQSNDDAKHRISDSPLGLHPLYLPEILTEIFSYLAEDKTLYPTLFVNRLWYLCSAPILWKRVEFVGCKKSLIYWKKFKEVVHTRKSLYISKLNELYISRCKVSGGTLYQIRGLCPNLRRLTISNCHGFSSETIGRIVYPSLIYLKFRHHRIKDKTIYNIASSCPNLTYLYLGYSEYISDISIIEIAKSCQKLKYIKIGGAHITDISLKEIAHLCSNLQHIHLIDCEKVTDYGISVIATSYPNMLSFSFTNGNGLYDKFNNEGISDVSVKKIAQCCPDLQYLNASWNCISDDSICIIVRSCPNLEQLYLEGCNITDVTMTALANLCNLQKLDIEECDRISINAIITLQNKNPALDIVGWYPDTNSESGISL
ncbi:13651_t:CDS:1 [Entrophospora sp. SA101]|nr:13651_t:CDS:1 [Entrophospora sp. SA101]CAJ0874969.1 17272_t:CDS:1 [Entrophospora sp. SA101]